MRRFVEISVLALVLVMVLAACTAAIEQDTTPMSDGSMEEETMEGEKMDEAEELGEMSDDMDKVDQKKDGMTDDGMMNDDMDQDRALMNVGDPAPAFSLMNLEGETVALNDFAGEKLYIKYWASWCSICVSGLAEVDELAGMNDDFQVITIVTPGFGGEKSAEDFKGWFAAKGTENLTVLLDTDGKYAKEFGVRGFPTSAYIGSDGILVKTAPGHVGNGAITGAFEAIQ